MHAAQPPDADAAPRRWPVRLILVGVVFALVLPGLVFFAVLVNRIATGERVRSQDAAHATAVRTADALDRELGSLSAALAALATSSTLDQDDLAGFDRRAQALAGVLGRAIVLSDPDGQQLVNTRRPFGAAMPRMQALATVRAAVATKRVAVSGLFMGATTGLPSIAVMQPVLRDDDVRFVLAVSLQPDHLSALLQQQGLLPGWFVSVTDGARRLMARTAETAAPGRSVPWLGGASMLTATEGMRMADWHVEVAAPMRAVEAPLRSTMALIGVTGVVTLAMACLLAWTLASSVAAPLQRLAEAGGLLAQGLPVPGVRSAIAEVDAVSRALVQATRDLRARADALAAERAQLAAVIDTVPVGLVIAEAGGRIVAGNALVERMLRHPIRYSRSDAEYGEWVSQHVDGRPVRAEEYPLAQVLRGAAQAELKCVYQRGDGTPLWVQFVAAPIRGPDGAVTGGVVAALDIDEVVRAREAEARFTGSLERQVAARTAELEQANQRLRGEMEARAAAEEQLRQAQKMEAVGQLTGGIAHDFNNLLTIVIGSLDLLRRRAADDRSRRLLDNAMDGATRAATLTARLLAFSRRQPLMPQPVDVNRLVAGMSDLLHRTLGESVRLETVLAGGVRQAHADPNQLENALLNLAVNGRDALVAAGRPSGRLVIETANAVLDDPSLGSDVPPGEYVAVSVADDGAGMPEEVAARVFEPFFTTKPVGQGTGLGLSQVHGFVKQSGGHVTIRTAVGEGTTVTIYLPRFQGAAPGAPETVEDGVADQPGLTVLLVEDDGGVRRFSVEALRELGHTVLEADGAEPALRLLDAHPEVRLLLTDVVLPGQSGVELAAEATRRRPGLPVLFASGYRGAGAEGLLPRDAPLLQKPFTVQALGAGIRDLMRGGG